MIATQPLSEQLRHSILPRGETAADCKKLMHHFRLEPDGRLLFGGRGGLWTSNKASAYDPLSRGLTMLFPELRDVPIDYRWSGKVAITVDGGPHFHRPAPGLIVAMGCNGRGVGMCTAAGKLLCELVNGLPDSESPMPMIPLKEIPLHGLRFAGAQAAVWYKAWQDRRDYRRAK
jgi:sarcosine oxidase